MAQREGYLLIDHQASPGIPEDVALKIGMDPKLVAEGKVLEAATLTCAHCKGTIVKNPFRKRERATCPKCSFKYLCDDCSLESRLPGYDHLPFEKKVDFYKNLAAQGLILGSPQGLLNPPPKIITP